MSALPEFSDQEARPAIQRQEAPCSEPIQFVCSQASRIIYLPSLPRSVAMKAFLLACAAAIVIAAVSVVVLNQVQDPVQRAFATTGVRL